MQAWGGLSNIVLMSVMALIIIFFVGVLVASYFRDRKEAREMRAFCETNRLQRHIAELESAPDFDTWLDDLHSKVEREFSLPSTLSK